MSSLHLFLFMKPALPNLKSHVKMLQAWREHRPGLQMQGRTRFAGLLGGFVGVGMRLALYLMVHCMLSGSDGWCSAWREPWGKSCLKKSLPYGTSSPAAVWLPQKSREGGVENGWVFEMHLWTELFVYKLFKVNDRHTLVVWLEFPPLVIAFIDWRSSSLPQCVAVMKV